MLKQKKLELSILKIFLIDNKYAISSNIDDLLNGLTITNRKFTGVGFFTTISIENIVFSRDNVHWGKNISCTINDSIEIGFLAIPEDKELTIEGFTYGNDEYPDIIESYHINKSEY